MKIELGFHGAAENVTGSCYHLKVNGLNILVDCGLYQEHDLKERNWDKWPVYPGKIDMVFLTHAHLDHCGLLPKLVADGFNGPIYATPATIDIAKIVLLDSARINEEDAEQKRRRHIKEGRTVQFPERPLYTEEEVKEVFSHFVPHDFSRDLNVGNGVTARFYEIGHILGASCVKFTIEQDGETRRILFSGDVGRWDMPILRDPAETGDADYVLIESTYGDRLHGLSADIPQELAAVINDTVKRGGNLVVPSFAVERTQEMLYYIAMLLKDNAIPHLQVFVDSPMASNVSDVFTRHPYLFDKDTVALSRTMRLGNVTLVRTSSQSKMINHIRGSVIIIAGSGMCTGGRIKHHLVANIERPESTILFIGYQANNTLGRQICDGESEVRILGEQYQVLAKVEKISGFSAHADRDELCRWLETMPKKPRKVFVTHGEKDVAHSFASHVSEKYGIECYVPKYMENIVLD